MSSDERMTYPELEEQQRQLCADFECKFVPVSPSSKIGFAVYTKDRLPMNGLRHPPQEDTNGWYLWGGDDFPEADDAFAPLHVIHLLDYRPEVIKFLGLPPGYRFLAAGEYVDVWFDASLLSV